MKSIKIISAFLAALIVMMGVIVAQDSTKTNSELESEIQKICEIYEAEFKQLHEQEKQIPSVSTPSQVSPLTNYLTEYKVKYSIIRREVDRRDDLNVQQKQKLYDLLVEDLKNRFRKIRTVEYEAVEITVSKNHSCTNKVAGKKKNCRWKCAKSPNTANYYTQAKWVKVKGHNKGLRVTENRACLKMTKSGKGRNAGTVYAIFKFRPAAIPGLVDQDWIQLFNLIGS